MIDLSTLRAHEETRAFRQAAGDAVTKVILETCYLTDDEIRRATEHHRLA